MSDDDYLEYGFGRPPIIGRHRAAARIGTSRAATGNGEPVFVCEPSPWVYTPTTWNMTVEQELKQIIDYRNFTARRRVRRRVWSEYRRMPICRVCGRRGGHPRRYRAWCSDRCEATERDLQAKHQRRRTVPVSKPPVVVPLAPPDPPSPYTPAEQAELDRAAHARHLARIALIAPQED